MPTFGSLFAGIGGIDLGLERAGWECRFQVEWSGWCQHNLAHHWPDIPRYGDITAVDWGSVERVDLLAGGFPCQPVSSAGRQKAQADERWLWPEFHRAIRELRPRLVLMENVTNLLAVNDGSAFGDVLGDLAAIGYDAEWDCIPVSAIGALHDRDRVWIVAYPESDRRALGNREHVGRGDPASDGVGDGELGRGRSGGRTLADSDGEGLEGRVLHAERADQRLAGAGRLGYTDGPSEDAYAAGGGSRSATSQPGRWLPEPDVGRVASGVPARVDRLRALGNAVVPQVVEVIGRRLMEALA